jgi:undecaprenyl-diphosphatase
VSTTVLTRLDARDRALFARCILASSSRRARRYWLAVTHLGGVVFSIAAAVIPLLVAHGALATAARHATVALVASHVAVQIVKRTVGRPRPSARGVSSLVDDPDRFSFPSGHSAAAMSVAVAYALTFPVLAIPLILLALHVGMSRVFLGVHYPGDVLIGQLIAVLTALVAAAP